MADDEQAVSPEEKLLKVIQGDNETASPETPAVDEKTASPKGEEVGAAEKPKLRLADKKPESGADVPQAAMGDEPVEADGAGFSIEAAPLADVGSKWSGRRFGVGAVNKCLVVLILFILAMLMKETAVCSRDIKRADLTTLRVEEIMRAPVPEANDEVVKPSSDGLVALEPLLEKYMKDVLIKNPAGPGPGPNTPTPVRSGWKAYVEKNVVLTGTSLKPDAGSKKLAILVDRGKDSMFILSVGDKVTIEGYEIEVKEIQSRRVVLVKDGEKVTVTAGDQPVT